MRLSSLHILVVIFFSGTLYLSGQNSLVSDETMTYEQYIEFVREYHPLVKRADLNLEVGESEVLKARGGFDPKLEIDLNEKQFKNTEYFDQLNATLKIPTWYGIEFKANFEENTGSFLNPELTVPEGGLYSAGVSVSLAQDLLINDRMATLKKAKFLRSQTQAERELLLNEILFDASKAYFEWLQASVERNIYIDFLDNARIRFEAVKRSVETGDKAAIDSVEAKITWNNRKLNLQVADLKRRKAALKASNFLWFDEVPLELRANVNPVIPENDLVKSTLFIDLNSDNDQILENHPKLQAIDFKIGGLTVDRNLKRNKLLPRLDVEYNFLSEFGDQINTFNTQNYKAMVNFSVPLFLRKERGDLRLSNLKLQDANYDRLSVQLDLRNKVDAAVIEMESLEGQLQTMNIIVDDYERLVNAEDRKFILGESSLFLVNTREQKLIDARLKENKIRTEQLIATAMYFKVSGRIPVGLMN